MPPTSSVHNWVVSFQAADFWFWATAIAVAALLLGYGAFHYLHRTRLIENTPTSKIRSAVQGFVELHGDVVVAPDAALTAPLTGTQCAWYRYKIERRRSSRVGRSHTTRWQTVESATSEIPFILEDETGSCVIDPRGAEVMPETSRVWFGTLRHPKQKPKQSASGLFGMLLEGTGNFRYTEERLHAGDRLYALGDFRSVSPASREHSLSHRVSAVLRKWKENQLDLQKRFDANRDGVIDESEWHTARSAAEAFALTQRLQQSGVPATHMLARPRSRRQPFLLSHLAELSLTRQFRIKAVACSAGFLLLGPATFWFMLIRLASNA